MFLGTKSSGNENSSERKVERNFPRMKGPGNESSIEVSFSGNESSRERKVSGTKVPHRDYLFLGTKGLGHEKSQYRAKSGGLEDSRGAEGAEVECHRIKAPKAPLARRGR